MVLVAMLTLGACGSVESPADAPASSEPPSEPAPGTGPDPSSAGASDGERAGPEGTSPATGPSPCEGLRAATAGAVSEQRLIEASGLAVSRQHDGIIWAHNDSGSSPELFAIGFGGESLGSIPVAGITGIDIEDMALDDGVVHLADIGDNNEARTEIVVYRFPEPEPTASESGPVDRITLRYPDGAHDAEAFLVDPVSGEFVIVAKQFSFGGGASGLFSAAPANVYRAMPTEGSEEPLQLQLAGSVALDTLDGLAAGTAADGLASQLGLSGVATAIDIRADGQVIALRTYGTVWLFDRAAGQTVAEALAGQPCEAPTVAEEMGEAVAFLTADSNDLVTIAEGTNPAINLIRGG